jgi:hypothetical protein
MKPKIKMPLHARLTLASDVFIRALDKRSPLAGVAFAKRTDGKYDVMVKASVYGTLKQMAEPPNENLSDTARRILF